MKISLSEQALEEIIEIEEEGEIADSFLNDAYFALAPEELSLIGSSMKEKESPSQSYRRFLLKQFDQETKEMYARVQVGYGLDEISQVDEAILDDNPYYQRVKATFKEERKVGPWTYGMKSFLPYELFVVGEVLPTYEGLMRYSPVGFFPNGKDYPALSRGNRVYMSLVPHEVSTMAEPIAKARGDVLTMGLGMGYFAFMASQKQEVTTLTVYERDATVVKLFKELFLPLFDHPEKIRIIEVNDALTYQDNHVYDYLFMDLHHDAVDGLPLYIRLLQKTPLAEQQDVWIEKALLHYLRRHVVALLEEEADGYTDEDYRQGKDFSEKLICALHFHLKNFELTDESLSSLLSDETLRRIAKEIKL